MMKLEKTDEYQVWFTGLSDKRVKARIRWLQDGKFGDVEPVGEGVSELKLHFGNGWRVAPWQKLKPLLTIRWIT